MKKITLIANLLIAFAVTGYTQVNTTTCTLPPGIIVGQGVKMSTFNNPKNSCAQECGIVTPGIGGNNPGNIIFPPEYATTSLSISFGIFVFDANLNCSSDKDFPTPTYVTGFIVDSSYTDVTKTPTSTEYYGKSKVQLLRAHGLINFVDVPFDPSHTPDPTKKYRIFLDFSRATNGGTGPVAKNTKFVIQILAAGGPLPVSLSSFLAGRTGSSISLNWRMEGGFNVSNFEIERSFNNSSYTSIAVIPGKVNGSAAQSYSYVDNSNTSKSVSFYRLKIVKLNGEIEYSNIKTVKGLGGNETFMLFPNPSIGNTRITITDISEPTNIQLFDNSGGVVKSVLLNNSNSVEINGLQKGAYIVKITGTVSGTTTVKKLIVIN